MYIGMFCGVLLGISKLESEVYLIIWNWGLLLYFIFIFCLFNLSGLIKMSILLEFEVLVFLVEFFGKDF